MQLPAGTGASFGFMLAIAALIVIGALSFYNVRIVADSEGQVAHTHAVISSVRNLELKLVQAESAQRGYIVSANPMYRDLAREALASLGPAGDDLRLLISDNPIQVERLDALRLLITERLHALEEGVKIKEGGDDAQMKAFIVRSPGRALMQTVNEKINEIEATEQVLLSIRVKASESSLNATLALIIITTLLGLGLVGISYTLTSREVKIRQKASDDLTAANAVLEDRVAERTTELADAAESLRRSNRELEQFASVASHDLQEPLRKIQAFGDRLQEKCAPELGDQGRQYVDRMLASAVRMRNLIDSLLNYSRVTTKARPFVSVDLDVITGEVVSDLEGRIKQTSGRVDASELPVIDADAVQMRQLMQNLIANGLKFNKPDERPVVKVSSRLFRNEGGVEQCEISIADNGIGFDEVYLDRIFDVFQRLHGRQEYEGTGMGLAICRRIVERHGGSITAKSELGSGATFIVTLPIRQEKGGNEVL